MPIRSTRFRTIWSGDAMRASSMVRHLLACVLLFGLAPSAWADEELAFDRPGIPFSPSTLPAGGFAWEQGLPSVSFDRSEGTISREYVADTVLRFGLGERVELQLSSDSQVWLRDSGAEPQRGHSGGDAAIGLKLAMPSASDAFSWALLATASMPTGREPYGSGEHLRTLATTLEWELPLERSFELYADVSDADDGSSWTLAANYTFLSRQAWQAYVEAGIGHGEEGTQGVGAGVAWMLGEHVQLDCSLLRGIGDDAPDWQGGIGLSFGFL
jgi:hypothetical protein